MGLLDEFLAAVDNRKRQIKNGLLDAWNNPNDYAEMQAARINEDRYGGAEELQAMRNQLSGKPYDKSAYQRAEANQIKNTIEQGGNAVGAIRGLWHGSPHKMPPTAKNPLGEFDFSKIGTGEGAQAYGHGGYLAESKEVGVDYKDVLASPRNMVSDKRGVYIEPSPMGDGTYGLATSSGGQMRGHVGDATQPITDYDFPNLASAIKHAKKKGWLDPNERPRLNAIGEDGKYVPIKKASDTKELLGYEPHNGQFIASDDGYLYKVDLAWPDAAKEAATPLKAEDFLHWDKPLSEQPKNVQAVADMLSQTDDVFNAWTKNGTPIKGSMIYERLSGNNGMQNGNSSGRRLASDLMNEQGIPGIRYLDGGSRGAGEGSFNYVFFSPDMATIVERNGKGLLSDAPVRQPTQYELAHETARKNAVEMLGLPENNTAMDRARALGGIDAYTGTKSDVQQFDLSKAGATDPGLAGKAVYSTPSAEQASEFAINRNYGNGDSPNVMPLVLIPQKTAISQDGVLLGKSLAEIHPNGITKQSASKINKELSKGGYDTVQFNLGNDALQYASLNPSSVRSRFAAFDPARINEADIMGYADPRLLGLTAGGGLLGLGTYKGYQE